MKRAEHLRAAKWLALCLALTAVGWDYAGREGVGAQSVAPAGDKVSPYLRDRIQWAKPGERVRVILQVRDGAGSSLDASLSRNGARQLQRLDRVG
ncbi:MAG: hypothetical protein M3268_09595, partial [Acidobacteriota bacterium]|nr:hypothetical protein [Acidobacteriota bacterium]